MLTFNKIMLIEKEQEPKDKTDIYENIDDYLENDEISPEEEAFLQGYKEAK